MYIIERNSERTASAGRLLYDMWVLIARWYRCHADRLLHLQLLPLLGLLIFQINPLFGERLALSQLPFAATVRTNMHTFWEVRGLFMPCRYIVHYTVGSVGVFNIISTNVWFLPIFISLSPFWNTPWSCAVWDAPESHRAMFQHSGKSRDAAPPSQTFSRIGCSTRGEWDRYNNINLSGEIRANLKCECRCFVCRSI